MITEYLKENNLIICPNYLKKTVVENINSSKELISFKVMDLREFKESYLYKFSKKTIYCLMSKFNLKYETALEYLDACYYIDDKKYDIDKLNRFVNIKKYLIENNLLIYDNSFNYYLKNVNIIIYGYYKLDPFYLKIFNKYDNVNFIYNINTKKQHIVYGFTSIEDELLYVCQSIKNNLDKGIAIQNLKLVTPSNEYIEPLKRIFNWCHIPVVVDEKKALYNIPVGKEILELVKTNMSFDEIITAIKDKHDQSIINQVIAIFNEYIDIEVESKYLYDLLEYDLKNSFLANNIIKNAVTCVPIETLTPNDYGYLLGFNKENYPVICKDEELLTDKMKETLGLFTSNESNINNILLLKNNLNIATNLFISYKEKTAFESYNPSIIIEEENYQVIKNNKVSFNVSNLLNKMVLAKEYDNYYKYGIHSEELDLLRYNYPNINYREYNNQFTGIDKNELHNYLKKPFTVSYSTIDEYYRCSFRYYISSILKINQENFDEFYQNIGNIFHYVLSKCFKDDFDFDKSWNEEANKYEFTLSKLILLEKLKSELKYDIAIIKKQLSYTGFNEFLYEKRFSLNISNSYNIPTNFVGIVDKISYLKENNRTLVSIIDYKTGHLPSNLNNIVYGIGMQLPIYLYFAKRSDLFPNMEIVGFYLQKIINKDMKVVKDKTLDELKENALKLVGYSIDDEELLEKFDFTYQDSAMINGLKKKKEGFYAYSKVLNNKQIDMIDKLVDDNINKAVNNILEGNFNINPKKIDKDNIGCEFCSYRDICYKKEEDIVELPKHQNLDFLSE